MAMIGCYTLDLYCDNSSGGCGIPDEFGHEYNEFPHEYIYEKGSTCRREARKDGWKLNMDTQDALCPKCARREADAKKVKGTGPELDDAEGAEDSA